MNVIKRNLESAISYISLIPESSVNLDEFESSCGTCFCLAGWLCQNEYFVEQNLRTRFIADIKLDDMFGENALFNLFVEYGHGNIDSKVMNVYVSEVDDTARTGSLSHKELAIARLKYQLTILESQT